ncbi:MAG: hypothetical protein GC146_05575 [Limimaricola sp.]|uniref:hypothetical protein n=1 Tax=Limimaricola sp. TaxID=2211665 RepID=UPI001D3A033B|nr:hypothetical protein [Limimaricola sp.]MBI1416677.1 hypothetical protein [Limimaricola sp.]
MKRNRRSARSRAGEMQARIAEIDALFQALRASVRHLQAQVETGGPGAVKAALAKLGELQTAHVALIKAEERFHDIAGEQAQPDDIDFDAIRDEIGRRLADLRATKD